MNSTFSAAAKIGAPEDFRNGLQWHRILDMRFCSRNDKIDFPFMGPINLIGLLVRIALCLVVLTTHVQRSHAQTKPGQSRASGILILKIDGRADVARAGSAVWDR